MSSDITIIALATIIARQKDELEKMQSSHVASRDIINSYCQENNKLEEKIKRARLDLSMPIRHLINLIGDDVYREKVPVGELTFLFDRGLVRGENTGLSSKDPGIQLTELGKLFTSNGESSQ